MKILAKKYVYIGIHIYKCVKVSKHSCEYKVYTYCHLIAVTEAGGQESWKNIWGKGRRITKLYQKYINNNQHSCCMYGFFQVVSVKNVVLGW